MGTSADPLVGQTAEQPQQNSDPIEAGGIIARATVYQDLTVEQVAALVAELERDSQPIIWDGRIPYPGLKTFEESDADLFFGREELVNGLLERVQVANFIVISGPSGSGKSSVARAGLLHALRRGRLDGSDKWLLASMQPKDDPIEELARVMTDLAGAPDAGDYIREKGRSDPNDPRQFDPDALHNQVGSLLADDPRQRLVLLVDQFEELFTRTKDELSRVDFINLLTTAAVREESRTTIILTMRSDFISNCALYPQLRELLSQEFQLVGSMEPRDLVKAITLPSLDVGIEIEPALVKQIIDDMNGRPDALPLMSSALHDLFLEQKTRKGDSIDLTLQDYLDRGGIDRAPRLNLDKQSLTIIQTSIEAREAEVAAEEERIRQNETLRKEPENAGWIRRFTTLSGVATAFTIIAVIVAIFFMSTARNEANQSATIEAEMITEKGTSDANAQLVDTHAAEARAAEAITSDIQIEIADLQKRYQASRLAAASGPELVKDQEAALLLATAGLGLSSQPDTLTRFYTAISAPFPHVLDGHQGPVWSAGFSPDGQQIVTAGWDGSAKVWDVQGNELASLDGHQGRVNSAGFSPDGRQIATASEDGSSKVWNVDGNELASLNGHADWVWSARFSPDGQQIVTASWDGSAKVWDMQGNELASLDGHQGGVWSAGFSPDGQRIVTASEDGTARIWDVDGNVLASLDGHTETVWSAVFSPDGRRIVTASEDGSAKVWNVGGIELATLDGHMDWVWSAGFSPDGRQIITTSEDGSAKIWDVHGNELASLEGHTGGVLSASFSPDGRRIVTASGDGNAKIWDVGGNELASLEGHTDTVRSAGFSPDGRQIVTASEDGTARVWVVNSNVLLTLAGHQGRINSAGFSPDGQQIVTAGEDGSVKIWDVGGNELATLDGHTDAVRSSGFSPDGERIVTASADGSAKIWDVGGNELATLDGHTDAVRSSGFSPDGERIVTASADGSAKVWDIDGNELLSLEGHRGRVNSVGFSPDGQQIVTAGADGSAKVWDIDGDELATLYGHTGWIRSARFSPDGQRIVTASEDGSARVWDVYGNEQAYLAGHTATVLSADFSPDGQQIITASEDGTARIWDVDGNVLASLDGHTDAVRAAEFSPDGQQIVTASGDGSAKVWRTYPTIEDKLELARARLSAGFTDEECRRFFRDNLEICPRELDQLFALFDDDLQTP